MDLEGETPEHLELLHLLSQHGDNPRPDENTNAPNPSWPNDNSSVINQGEQLIPDPTLGNVPVESFLLDACSDLQDQAGISDIRFPPRTAVCSGVLGEQLKTWEEFCNHLIASNVIDDVENSTGNTAVSAPQNEYDFVDVEDVDEEVEKYKTIDWSFLSADPEVRTMFVHCETMMWILRTLHSLNCYIC